MPFVLGPITFYTYLIGAVSFGEHYRESRRLFEEKTAEAPPEPAKEPAMA
jgi:hypothetical protein